MTQVRVWPRRWSDKNKAFRTDVENVQLGRAFAEQTSRDCTSRRPARPWWRPVASQSKLGRMRGRGAVLPVAEDLLPLSEIEADASGVVRRLHETRRPVILTEDGRPAAVLMTPDEYEGLHERERVVGAIERGRADLRAGRVMDDDDFACELDREFGPAE